MRALEEPAGNVQPSGTMHFSVVLPDHVALEMEATKIVAEAVDGSFALLPRHLDWIAPVVPGVVLVTGVDSGETIVGTDEGTLVKCGRDVVLATRRAVAGQSLAALRDIVERSFRSLDQHETQVRSALSRLETGILRHFVELE